MSKITEYNNKNTMYGFCTITTTNEETYIRKENTNSMCVWKTTKIEIKSYHQCPWMDGWMDR